MRNTISKQLLYNYAHQIYRDIYPRGLGAHESKCHVAFNRAIQVDLEWWVGSIGGFEGEGSVGGTILEGRWFVRASRMRMRIENVKRSGANTLSPFSMEVGDKSHNMLHRWQRYIDAHTARLGLVQAV